MKIGIDLDGVIFDSEKEFRVYAELYDLLELKRNSIINKKEIRFQDRYKWNQKEINAFFEKYHKYIMENANFMPGAKEVVKLLKKEGNELIIITARGGLDEKMIKVTQQVLEKNNMNIFDKCYWAIENKEEICKKEKIDIMIDDSYKNCQSIAKSKIETIYLKDAPSYELEESKYLKILYNWGEIYRYVKELSQK